MSIPVDLTAPTGGAVVADIVAPARRRAIRARVVQASAAAQSLVSVPVPKNSKVVAVGWKYVSTITLSGGSAPARLAIGTGTAGDPDELALCSATLTAGTSAVAAPLGTDYDFKTSAVDIYVTAVATGGGADGNWVGTVDLYVVYDEFANDPTDVSF